MQASSKSSNACGIFCSRGLKLLFVAVQGGKIPAPKRQTAQDRLLSWRCRGTAVFREKMEACF